MVLGRSTEGKSARDSGTSSSGDGSREPASASASDIVCGVADGGGGGGGGGGGRGNLVLSELVRRAGR